MVAELGYDDEHGRGGGEVCGTGNITRLGSGGDQQFEGGHGEYADQLREEEFGNEVGV